MIFTAIDALQWSGCAAGSLLLALNTKHSGWGFVLFSYPTGFGLRLASRPGHRV